VNKVNNPEEMLHSCWSYCRCLLLHCWPLYTIWPLDSFRWKVDSNEKKKTT